MRTFITNIGDKIGFLEVIALEGKANDGRRLYRFKCKCGKEIVAKRGRKSCGCVGTKGPSIEPGTRYGRLVVVSQANERYFGRRQYLFRCDCGQETTAPWGEKKSCGCLRRDTCSTTGKRKTLPDGKAALHRLFRNYKNNADQKGIEFIVDLDEFQRITSSNCHYCGQEPTPMPMTNRRHQTTYNRNGIDRVDDTKGYISGNCVACCKWCNYAKRERTPQEFLLWVRRVFEHNYS